MVLSITNNFNINSQQSVDGGFRAYGSNAPESTVCGLLRSNMKQYKTKEEREIAKKESRKKYQQTEKGKEASRRSYKKNKSKIRAHSYKFRQENKDKITEAKLKNKFGITLSEYIKLEKKQNGLCKICGLTCSSGNKLAVDHCHKTGKVRGLLCSRCNLGLGHFLDNKENLQNAISYLIN